VPRPRSQPVVHGSMADFRPASSRTDEGRSGHHKGDGTQPSTHIPRDRRNGLPEFEPYVYRGTGEDQYADQYGEDL
jgi:hypothetical protein